MQKQNEQIDVQDRYTTTLLKRRYERQVDKKAFRKRLLEQLNHEIDLIENPERLNRLSQKKKLEMIKDLTGLTPLR